MKTKRKKNYKQNLTKKNHFHIYIQPIIYIKKITKKNGRNLTKFGNFSFMKKRKACGLFLWFKSELFLKTDLRKTGNFKSIKEKFFQLLLKTKKYYYFKRKFFFAIDNQETNKL